ncbi:MAG: adenylate/guanylate cyclase domain-containing protein [Tepidamorphaceae bacterium]|nr:2Fe-2S iron-sulfur cluster binding domain-containing protein [Rhodobiaceae bacterium]MCC0047659.1 2Fe-2S iron-sulfur cluster binding domain-containing protein [Rhodobiaceae bacterium]
MDAISPPRNMPKWPAVLVTRRLRIATGLVLFVFVATHLLNHALGLVSIDAMEAARDVRVWFTRSLPGTIILLGSALIHMVLGITKFMQRRVWRIQIGEVIQLAFGLLIPVLLFRHIIGTRIVHELYGVTDDYDYALFAMWPAEAWRQAILILLVWVHGVIGLHVWLRMRPWYAQWRLALGMLAALVPVLGFAGFAVAGREIRFSQTFNFPMTSEQVAQATGLMSWALWGYVALLASFIAIRFIRDWYGRFQPRVRISYANGPTVACHHGPTLLEMSRAYGIPHASICGGRGRCSTCRVRVIEGGEEQAPPDETEARVLKRIGAADNVRLACQLHPRTDMTVVPLLPASSVAPGEVAQLDKYHWGVEQTVTLMFTDIRGFTRLTEHSLAYDVVFLLNMYLGRMSEAVTDAGGYVDKFMGDGLMAIFGMDGSSTHGARQAVEAARAMGGILEGLNQSLSGQLDEPLRIGIGLHTGPAVLGRIGAARNHDAGNRISALGDTVNTASRVESSCKDLAAQLVMTEAARKAAGLELPDESRHTIEVRGKSEPLTVYAFARALEVTLPEAPQAGPKPKNKKKKETA